MSFTFKDDEIAIYVKDHVICGLCRELVRESVGCNNCATLFCGNCVDNLLSHQALHGRTVVEQCPFCKSQLGFCKNVFVDKMLVNFNVQCEYCDQIMSYLDHGSHLSVCPEMLLSCELCGKMEKRKDHNCSLTKCEYCDAKVEKTHVDSHLEHQCPEIPVSCQFCETALKRKEVDVHQRTECLMYPMVCTYCSAEMTRQEFANHYATCDEYIQMCTLCTVRFKNKDGHNCQYELCQHCNNRYDISNQSLHDATCPSFYCLVCKIRVDNLPAHIMTHQPNPQ